MRPVSVTTSNAASETKFSATVPLEIFTFEAALQIVVSGSATYTIQQTLDNPFGSAALTWFDHPISNLVNATTSQQGNYDFVPRAVRIKQTAGSGSVTLTVTQPVPGV